MASYSVFVSHSHFDNDFCNRLIEYVYQHLPEVDIWYDETELHGGDEWQERIERELDVRPIFVVILSARSVEAPWVRQETHTAISDAVNSEGTRWVIPVRHKICEIKKLSKFLARRQIIDCVGEHEERGFERLVEAIRLTATKPLQPIIGSAPADGGDDDDQSVDHERARKAAAGVHAAFKAGKWNNVVNIADNATREPDNEDDAELWGEVGIAFARVGLTTNNPNKLVEAVKALNVAIKNNAHHPDYWRWKAKALAGQGDVRNAFAMWLEAILWTSSSSKQVEIYSEMCDAATKTGHLERGRDFAAGAIELVDEAGLGAERKLGWEYWAQQCVTLEFYDAALTCCTRGLLVDAESQAFSRIREAAQQGRAKQAPHKPTDNKGTPRPDAFEELRIVVRDLKKQGVRRLFSHVGAALRKRGIQYDVLGYRQFLDFVREAEARKIVKVLWLGDKSQVFLPDEEVPLQAVTASEISSVASGQDAIDDWSADRIAGAIDILEKTLPFITYDSLREFFSSKASAERLPGIMAILDGWIQAGDVEVYDTPPLYPDHTGVPASVRAMRLNRAAKPTQLRLREFYDRQSSTWNSLPPVVCARVIDALSGYLATHPYITWNHLRTLLGKSDKTTMWNVVFATAVDEGIIDLGLRTIKDNQTGFPFTVKVLTINPSRVDSQAIS